MKSKYANVDLTGQSEHTEGLIIGLLIGAAIGACAAILFAPQSGKETREKIKDLAGKQTDNLDELWQETEDKASEAASKAKDTLDSAGSDAESKLKSFADKAENKAEDSMETFRDTFQKRY